MEICQTSQPAIRGIIAQRHRAVHRVSACSALAAAFVPPPDVCHTGLFCFSRPPRARPSSAPFLHRRTAVRHTAALRSPAGNAARQFRGRSRRNLRITQLRPRREPHQPTTSLARPTSHRACLLRSGAQRSAAVATALRWHVQPAAVFTRVFFRPTPARKAIQRLVRLLQ